jgi:hypothetical protein
MERNGQQMREKAEKPGKEAARLHSEQHAAPTKGHTGPDSRSTVHTVAKPSEVAKPAGTPNRLIVT